MNSEIPEFQIAVSNFRRFLAQQGHPESVFWVFRDDLWLRRGHKVLMRSPVRTENDVLAEKVYDEGRQRGLVSITAIATDRGRIAATVWFPKFPGEEVQGWYEGLKLAIHQPLPKARVVGGLMWWFAKRLPGYRRFQQNGFCIGSRRWAAA